MGEVGTMPLWIELSKSAFDHNVAQYKSVIGPTQHLSAVVKANAYGHGLCEIGRLCQERGVESS